MNCLAFQAITAFHDATRGYVQPFNWATAGPFIHDVGEIRRSDARNSPRYAGLFRLSKRFAVGGEILHKIRCGRITFVRLAHPTGIDRRGGPPFFR